MKQAKGYGDREIRLEEGPTPDPGPGEVLVRVRSCGICGGDLRAFQAPRERIKNPWVAGHEAAGVVEALGPETTGFSVGDRVAVEPTIAEEESPLTKIGRYELSGLRHIGGPAHAGGFAEYLVAPDTNLHKIPDEMEFHHAALAEVYAVAAHAHTLFPVQPGESVAVIGSGPVGVTVAEYARISGADPLVLIGKPDPQLRTVSDALGATTLHADSDDLTDAVAEATCRRGADVVFDAVGGSAPTVQQAIDIAAPMGRVCVIGGHSDPVSLTTGPARGKELVVGWSFCYGRRGIRKEFEIVIDLMAAGRLNAAPWVTHRFPLDEISEAFAAAVDRETGSIKVVVEP